MQQNTHPKPPILATLQLTSCWVCMATDGLHEHHVVPQAYGGTSGPTVTLCGSHHTLIHTLSNRKDHSQELAGLSGDQRLRLSYLVAVIIMSRTKWRQQQKVLPLQLMTTLDPVLANKFRFIQQACGASSQQKTLEYIVDAVYSQLAPLHNPTTR